MGLPEYKKASRMIYYFVRYLDRNPERKKCVRFFFYSIEESDVYRLAEELKELGFRIDEISHTGAVEPTCWLCLAETNLTPQTGVLNCCTDLLFNVADRNDSLYDGWETRIDPQTTGTS